MRAHRWTKLAERPLPLKRSHLHANAQTTFSSPLQQGPAAGRAHATEWQPSAGGCPAKLQSGASIVLSVVHDTCHPRPCPCSPCRPGLRQPMTVARSTVSHTIFSHKITWAQLHQQAWRPGELQPSSAPAHVQCAMRCPGDAAPAAALPSSSPRAELRVIQPCSNTDVRHTSAVIRLLRKCVGNCRHRD